MIDDATIYQIAQALPPHIDTFLLTSETNVEAIIAHHSRCKTTSIQIVDALKIGTYAQLKTALKGIKIVQVIHVLSEATIQEAVAISTQVDYLLLDSGNPNLAIKELGGTGRTHNWAISQKIVAQAKCPVFLAGGLRASNVQQAIQQVQPYGIDLCSGVRTNNQLDVEKLKAFFEAVKY